MASIYHPPDPEVYKATDSIEFLSDSFDQILNDDPDAKIVVAGDVNQLNIKEFTHQHVLQQMVKTPTRENRVLDVFLTNAP